MSSSLDISHTAMYETDVHFSAKCNFPGLEKCHMVQHRQILLCTLGPVHSEFAVNIGQGEGSETTGLPPTRTPE